MYRFSQNFRKTKPNLKGLRGKGAGVWTQSPGRTRIPWLWKLATVRRLITHLFPQVPPTHSPPRHLDKGQEEETARAVAGTLHSNLVPSTPHSQEKQVSSPQPNAAPKGRSLGGLVRFQSKVDCSHSTLPEMIYVCGNLFCPHQDVTSVKTGTLIISLPAGYP